MKERIRSIDFIKGFTIILVIVAHAIGMIKGLDSNEDRLYNYIYSFHMPLFMFVSGFVCYKIESHWADIKKRAYQLLIPFIAYPIITGLLLNGEYHTTSLINNIEVPDSGLWFLYVLFIISSFYSFANIFFRKFAGVGGAKYNIYIVVVTLVLFFILSALSVYFKIELNGRKDYGVSLVARHSIFYCLGLFAKQYYDEIRPLLVKYRYLFVIIWFLMASFWEFHHKPTFISDPNLFIEMTYYYLTAIVGILMVFSYSIKHIRQNTKNTFVRAMSYIGTISLGLYAMHYSFMLGLVYRVIGAFELNYWIALILLSLLTTGFCIILTRIVEKGHLAPQLLLGKVKFIEELK